MLSAISLYTGIGGLDFGFEQAGFETRIATDNDPTSCRTLRFNRPNWFVIQEDINSLPSNVLLEKAGLRVGEADVLIGGPPCQPFSKSSYWVRGDALRLDDLRADTLAAFLRVLRDTQPRTFLLENVHGLTYKGKDEGLRLILDTVEEINRLKGTRYLPTWKVIKCADYGVPQTRERVFIVASRDGRQFYFPAPTHGQTGDDRGDLFSSNLEPYTTAWDAIGDLPEPEDETLQVGGKWGDLLPSIPEGQNYLWHTNRGGGEPLFGWRTRYWSFLLKLAKGLPSWTIQAQPGSAIGPFHWNNRRLSFRELCRLQTFPDHLNVDCGRTEMQKMLGNAVPSLIAEILAREIKSQLLDAPNQGKLQLLPKRILPMPSSEPVAPIAEKYVHLIGDHADHPGSGKGRRAKDALAAAE